MVRRSLIALVAAEVISSLGTLMTVVTLPWFVLETTGSPQRMTVVLAAEAAPLALLALLSGRMATRLGARRTMLACDALWAPATAAIPLLNAACALSFGRLAALAFVCGIPAGAHFGAQSAIVPELLGGETAGTDSAAGAVPRLADGLALPRRDAVLRPLTFAQFLGIRVPPLFGVMTIRILAPVRAGTVALAHRST